MNKVIIDDSGFEKGKKSITDRRYLPVIIEELCGNKLCVKADFIPRNGSKESDVMNNKSSFQSYVNLDNCYLYEEGEIVRIYVDKLSQRRIYENEVVYSSVKKGQKYFLYFTKTKIHLIERV